MQCLFICFKCANGHSACRGCYLRFNRKCGTCAQPIGDVRCRLMEDHLVVVESHCKFHEYGCGETVKYTKARLENQPEII
jgi:E3 ubiquitin-protein ligase SIAH1